MILSRSRIGAILLALSAVLGTSASAQTSAATPAPVPTLKWRMIGPFRGGRTVGASGIASQPNVLFIGVNNGGVWKTTDYGQSWHPIFDAQPTSSIGDIAVAPSDPNVIYVGSGEGLQRPDLSTGDGVYRSADGGATWTNTGLRDAQQIARVAVDPTDANRVFVAALGHPYGPNTERGLYRTTDGGGHWERVLFKDENTGAFDVAIDPKDPKTVYAVLWSARQAPWEVGSSWTQSASNGLFKSIDGGSTWRKLDKGLPTAAEGLGRIGIDISASNPKRLYAAVGARAGGIYRSDDGGESWTLANGDRRLWERDGDFNEVRIDPTDPDVVYVANVVSWKSTDGGRTFNTLRGAPGGDDYHRFWINPANPKIILLTSDQGANVSVNGGVSWSSWYNQPTAQFYHVNTDNAFPYRVCGGQQESGSACVSSRGDDGHVTFREWHPVGVEEYGYAVPDPKNPDLVFGGKITRYDRRSGRVVEITPKPLRDDGYRVVRTAPVAFSGANPNILFFASNTVWKTLNGGESWTQISPDLSRPSTQAPANLGVFAALDPEKGAHRGVIYALGPSPVDERRLWAGTDDGLIHVTSDGGAHWRDVTPPALRDAPWSKISVIEASHFDTAVAYAAVNTFRRDDLRPHIYRTRDGGRSWQEIVTGIPNGGIVNVVREDPTRKGMLYAGTEQAVYVSHDDGATWRSLRFNMPATSIRDLVIHDADVVVATHGRGFWILDDVSPLRQLERATAAAPASLVKPHAAVRARWNLNTDTPLPPEEPAGQNPPDGGILDYHLASPASNVAIEIRDAQGALVRRIASTDPIPPPIEGRNIPDYWIRPPQTLGTSAGFHRYVWDLRYTMPPVPAQSYPISAVVGETPAEPRGPYVVPGRYVVRLIADGRTVEQPLDVTMDPRVRTPAVGLQAQLRTALSLADALRRDSAATAEIHAARTRIADRLRSSSDTALSALDARLAAFDGGAGGGRRGSGLGAGAAPRFTLGGLRGDLASLYATVIDEDAAPNTQMSATIAARLRALDALLAEWARLKPQATR